MISNSIPSLDPLITNLIELIWQCSLVKSLSRKYDCILILHCLEELIIIGVLSGCVFYKYLISHSLECWAEKWATIWNESILADVMELQSPAPIKRDCIAFLHSLWKPGHLLASVEIKWNYCPTTLLCDLLIQPSLPLCYGVKLKVSRGENLFASIQLEEKNWQQLVYQNENWKREKNWAVCTRIFGRIWLTWSGSVLKFSFQLRPAVCQNLIDIFHVLRNIQFNSDIKRPQCHWTLILISINMIVIGEDAAAFITLYSGLVTRLRHPRHLQPGVPPAHTSVPRKHAGY